jgi:hypothetical protein
LPAFASGEEHIVEEYDAAFKESASNSASSEILTRQRDTLVAKIAEMRKLAA